MTTKRRSPWWLWLVLALVLPLPYWAIEAGRVTLLQLFVFALATGAVAVTEPSGVTAFIASLFWIQALGYAFLLRFAARLLRRRVASTALIVLALLGLIALCAAFDVYRTPFSTTGATATLLELY